MTPSPDSVAAAIVAAGYEVSANAAPRGRDAPALWVVRVGDFGHQGARGKGRSESPRLALTEAMERLVALLRGRLRRGRNANVRRLNEHRVATAVALAAQVAAMWPEVTP